MTDYPVRMPDVEVYAGDTVEIVSARIVTNGIPVELNDWTGWTASWRPSPRHAESVALNVDTTGHADGRVTVTGSATATRAMQDLAKFIRDGYGYWDLQATKDGKVRTWLRGCTTNREDVTR